jgi:acetyl-CoA/propionyl-CoA carboxylase biotin carboxyl carrier protein
MIAKLIVTGKDRTQALERSGRALAELQVLGLPTVIPFHRRIVNHPAFVATDGKFDVYTRWIETEWNNDIEPWAGQADQIDQLTNSRSSVVVEVDGKRLEVAFENASDRITVCYRWSCTQAQYLLASRIKWSR